MKLRAMAGARPMGLAMAACLAVMAASGCAAVHYGGTKHHGDKYLDSRELSALNTTGIESSDLKTAVNTAVTKLLAHPALAAHAAPSLRVEAEDFDNDLEGKFNSNALADLLRHELRDAGGDRLRIVRASADEEDPVDAQYVVGGRITRVEAASGRVREAYTQILFEVVDAYNREVIFSDLYAFKKSATAVPSLY